MPTVEERNPDSIVQHARTADADDLHVAWTAQHLNPERDVPDEERAFPGIGYNPNTHFHPDELPDPDVAVAAGLMPQPVPGILIDEDHVTQSPLTELPLDHDVRAEGKQIAAERDVNIGNLAGQVAAEKVLGDGEKTAKRSSRRTKAADEAAADSGTA